MITLTKITRVAAKRLPRYGEAGFSLIEILLSVALLGIIAVVILSALDNVSRVTLSTDERQTASNLAESQMEYIKGLGYATAYEPYPVGSNYYGYSVNIDTATLQDNNIQRITITIGHNDKIAATLEGYKVR